MLRFCKYSKNSKTGYKGWVELFGSPFLWIKNNGEMILTPHIWLEQLNES